MSKIEERQDRTQLMPTGMLWLLGMKACGGNVRMSRRNSSDAVSKRDKRSRKKGLALAPGWMCDR
jgi:hypothetical protein